MNFLAVVLGCAAGALGMYALVSWELGRDDWRSDAWIAGGGFLASLVLAWHA